MRRFRLTAEGFREKFRNAKPESGETGAQFAARLASLFDRWVELAETIKEYDTLRNLVLTEQFIKGCSPKIAVFIKERGSKALNDMADLADRFLEAQGAQSLGFKVEEKKPNPDAPGDVNKKPAGEGRPPLRCFLCNRMGHRAADCRERGPKTPSCWRCGRTGHTANSCQEGSQDGTSTNWKVGKRVVTILRDTGVRGCVVRGVDLIELLTGPPDSETSFIGPRLQTTDCSGLSIFRKAKPGFLCFVDFIRWL
ncbi:hypothetical protein HPB47_008258 [Ixodes persulcatus]|uniref:Uncharacterized protein n=1 Tax=Ixodes persulcatus TaxID=34615 RepID=A0AC60P552_IXOPE|nr:hypothetical protein HPB47_008258 [Ixodes persulcatus]